MALVRRDGRVFGGADALVQIARHVWWAWPLFAVAHVPGMRAVLRAGYGGLAARRHCFGGACAVPRRVALADCVPLALFPMLAVGLRGLLPAWCFLWVLAVGILLGCKWLTYRQALAHGCKPTKRQALAYLFGWIGLDARSVFRPRGAITKSSPSEWAGAAAKTILGAVLFFVVAPQRVCMEPLLAGWLALLGLIFLLHFGAFHLLALAWRRGGVAVEPIMRAPALATSLSDFWGRRWNTAFSRLATEFIFRPLVKRQGVTLAVLAVFAVSGLVHELVISVPARGGYGLPLAYFLFQAAAVLCERTRLARRLGLPHGVRGWLFVCFCTAGPAYWLFHPPFLNNVILPMLLATGGF
jgi:alginate O-acetyltransferase complex protein AlgI